MNRLNNILLSMEPSTTTYTDMYEGPMISDDPQHPGLDPVLEYDPTYYWKEIGFRIEPTHKLAQDKPTVTVIIPADHLGIFQGSLAEADFCLREFAPYLDAMNSDLFNRSRPAKETGKYYLPKPSGEILPRNAAYFDVCPQKDYVNGGKLRVHILPEDQCPAPKLCLCFMLQVQLPFKKLKKTRLMLCRDLPHAVEAFIDEFDHKKLEQVQTLASLQTKIRSALKDSDYCAFIANGSILPREKATDQPMQNAVPFQSSPQDEIELCSVRGMGIRKGVTVITGGGYSGKSTLLDAISAGIADHVLGDGRELCITDESAVTITAEDGRSVKNVNVSPFIQWLPVGSPLQFSTDHASGSTSQAANIMEALSCGAKLLLIDEDRSATNFMIRDDLMKELIKKEPITPFTDRVNELYDNLGVSTILVIGGSGEYLSVADQVYRMDDFRIENVTKQAKELCTKKHAEYVSLQKACWTQQRILSSEGFTSYPQGGISERLEILDTGFLKIGDETIDLRGLHNLFSERQKNALGFLLRYLEIKNGEKAIDLNHSIDELYRKIEAEGIDSVFSTSFTTCERFLDLPRKIELHAVINRMRHVTFHKE